MGTMMHGEQSGARWTANVKAALGGFALAAILNFVWLLVTYNTYFYLGAVVSAVAVALSQFSARQSVRWMGRGGVIGTILGIGALVIAAMMSAGDGGGNING